MKKQRPLWEPKYRIEAAFRRRLLAIVRNCILKQVRRAGTLDDMIQILQKVSESEEYKKLCQAAAMKMVTGLFSDQGHTWRQAAANMKSRAMYEALRKELQGEAGRRLRELVDDTTYRIVTLPSDIGHQVADYVSRESLKGRRASDLEDEIRRMFPDKTQARAELIARTQVSMTSTNMTRQRAERYGMNWYIWRPVGGAAGDGRTRDSHRMMAGVLVNWNDPPAPETLFPTLNADGRPRKNTLGHYHAGCCPNCRCYPEPIVDLDQVDSWPAKVYYGGRIQKMNKTEFERIM